MQYQTNQQDDNSSTLQKCSTEDIIIWTCIILIYLQQCNRFINQTLKYDVNCQIRHQLKQQYMVTNQIRVFALAICKAD